MGAWGSGHFENDDALDWVWSLEDDEDASAIRDALETATRPGGKVDATDACCALAAATVVAAAVGRPTGEQLPDEAETWLRAHGDTIGEDLVALARHAVDQVREGSELRDLWNDEDPTEWLEAVDELQSRLPPGARAKQRRGTAAKPDGAEDSQPEPPSPPPQLHLSDKSDPASIAPRVAALPDRGKITIDLFNFDRRLPEAVLAALAGAQPPPEIVAELASALATRPDLELHAVVADGNSLEWITAFSGLRRLSVFGGWPWESPDLSPIGELHELRELKLGREAGETHIPFRNVLSGTPLLETLLVWSIGQGQDFDAVAGLAHLRSLELRSPSLATLDFLTGHSALEGLTIVRPEGGVHDLAPLATIPNLRVLELGGVDTADFTAIGDCTSLIWLRAARLDAVEDLAALARRPAETLRFLEFREMTGLTTLSHLAACRRLEEAVLDFDSLPADERLAGLATAPALTYLGVFDEYPETEVEAARAAFRGRCFNYRGKYLVGNRKTEGPVTSATPMLGEMPTNAFHLAVLDAEQPPAELA